MLNAEKWSALSWLGGRPIRPRALTEDWKKVLFNQFHDLLPGSGIGVIYKDAQKDYDVVRWSTDEITARALPPRRRDRHPGGAASPAFPWSSSTRSAGPAPGEVMVKLQLPRASAPASRLEVSTRRATPRPRAQVVSSEPRTGMVTLRIRTDDVPALGYAVLHVLPRAPQHPAKAEITLSQSPSSFTLRRDAATAVIDKATGCVTSLYDKRRVSRAWPRAAAATSCRPTRTCPGSTTPGTSTRAHTIWRRRIWIRSPPSRRSSPATIRRCKHHPHLAELQVRPDHQSQARLRPGGHRQ